jgi:hypothetical protein
VFFRSAAQDRPCTDQQDSTNSRSTPDADHVWRKNGLTTPCLPYQQNRNRGIRYSYKLDELLVLGWSVAAKQAA